jgi:DNA invertase Pin-like site-specific DNA recombinase
MFWSVDRLGRSIAAVTAAPEELDAAGVAIYADKEAMDTSASHGRAMRQMAAVFAELERAMIRERPCPRQGEGEAARPTEVRNGEGPCGPRKA